ncbi:hypothetical protein WOLCODRAFT_17454 [Wolfiporia cocos MD-104 SS10]|uniref:DUF6533 domain-containing protein n=1 Tax=Wolfiporia cocos (strain MD-104) TaxID=742152 RepID=A0A2H3JT33_WOLCO|nr:hypothetical protein WOLCODRAFT_17454 [Wolfiporia cocos MD-104 SS10]
MLSLGIALVVYDSVLMLSKEKELIWSKRSGSVIFFVLNRIVAASYCTVKALAVTSFGNSGIGFLSSVRVYAVRGGRMRLAIFTLLLGLAPVLEDILGYYHDYVGGAVTLSELNAETIIIMWRCLPIASDFIVSLSTWHACAGEYRDRAFHCHENITLPTLLLRDGEASPYSKAVATHETRIQGLVISCKRDGVLDVSRLTRFSVMSVASSHLILGIRYAGQLRSLGAASQDSTQLMSFVRNDDPLCIEEEDRMPPHSGSTTNEPATVGENEHREGRVEASVSEDCVDEIDERLFGDVDGDAALT